LVGSARMQGRLSVSHRVQNCVADVTHRGPSLTLRVTMVVYMEAEWMCVAPG